MRCPPMRCWLGFFAASVILVLTATVAFQAVEAAVSPLATAQEASPGTTGMIRPGSSSASEKRSMPQAVFRHDAHTEALGVDSCLSCHAAVEGDLDSAFRQTRGKTGDARVSAWHDGCFSCHAELAAVGKASGPDPASCRSCHDATTPVGTQQADGGLDAGLHERHIDSQALRAMMSEQGEAETCGACHHSLGETLPGTLKADSCRSCHGQGNEKHGQSFRRVAHESCISCHLAPLLGATNNESTVSSDVSKEAAGAIAEASPDTDAAGQAMPDQDAASLAPPLAFAGPVTCGGCHDAAVKAGYARPSPVRRLDAGQPDTVRMGGSPASLEAPDGVQAARAGQARFVLFNHALHEAQTDSCRSCHHDTTQACSDCHTQAGSERGGFKTAYQVMHDPFSQRSCVACHESVKTTRTECAGCHTPSRSVPSQASCSTCHDARPADAAPAARSLTLGELFAMLPWGQKAAPAKAAYPETVNIGRLSDEFEPGELPHGRIIRSLEQGIALATPSFRAVHEQDKTICLSCHHHSPPSADPPACASCHAASGVVQDGRPGLKVAYHQQCMTCHTRMELAKPAATDCASCHTPRPAAP